MRTEMLLLTPPMTIELLGVSCVSSSQFWTSSGLPVSSAAAAAERGIDPRRMPDALLGDPAVLGAQLERVAVLADLARRADIDAEPRAVVAAGLLQQVGDRHAAERVLAQPRDRGLRGGLALELLLDQLLVGDVEHDPVPEERSVGPADEHGAVADPDDVPVLVEHAVVQIERARAGTCLRLPPPPRRQAPRRPRRRARLGDPRGGADATRGSRRRSTPRR